MKQTKFASSRVSVANTGSSETFENWAYSRGFNRFSGKAAIGRDVKISLKWVEPIETKDFSFKPLLAPLNWLFANPAMAGLQPQRLKH